MDNNLALFLIHNIFLTNSQISLFFKKKEIEVVGVSIPVWVNAKTSETSEPALEIFCKYIIKHHRKESDVEILKNGYQLVLCNKKNKKPPKIDFEELSKMTMQQRTEFENKRNKWLRDNSKIVLENLKNGYYRTEIKKINQTFEKLPNCTIDVQHVIEIKTAEKLENSLVI